MLQIPALRFGQPYDSLDKLDVMPLGGDAPIARVSKVNAGIIKRDARRLPEARVALRKFTTAQLLDISRKAGELFVSGSLPVGDAQQSPADYVDCLSQTSGLPHTLVKANMAKIYEVFTEMGTILRGLTRGLDIAIMDAGSGEQGGVPVSYFPTTHGLGVVLPSNSPGVNSLWMPAVAMKIPVVLKPGSEEPWTPFRIIQSFIAAGVPPIAFGFYPTDHEGSAAVMDVCQRSIIFGGRETVERYAGNPNVEVHGPGWSKALIAEDEIENWPKYVDVLVQSIAANSGRSCINASVIGVPRYGRQVAQALAEKLVTICPLDRKDPGAKLSGFANPKMAEWADAQITEALQTPGAQDVTMKLRGGTPRLVVKEGITYLLPTIIRCDSLEHPLVCREFMFPYASVVEVPQEGMLERVGPTLVLTAITQDNALIAELLTCPMIQRLNLGPMPTSVARWDQPHEGNLFEFLYHRRAIQRAAVGV